MCGGAVQLVPWIHWCHKKTFSAHLNSFFKESHFDVQEILAFIREWLLKSSLHQCAVASGMDYKKNFSRLGELHAGHVSQIC